ncbi:MAG: glycosyltransferase family 39 protein [Candidatus Binatia bacterium]
MVHNAIALPASFNEYLDTGRSPLNPNNRGFGFYVYGDLPLAIVQGLGRWAARPDVHLDAWLTGDELGTTYGTVHRLGRLLSALCDTLALALLYAVGARLYGRAVGLLAAALYAAAVLPIQQAHFFTVDAMANLFVVAALWLAARAATRARWSDDALFGLALGAGLACKLSVFPIAALLAISVVLRVAAHAQQERDAAAPPRGPRHLAQLAVRALLSLNVVALTAVLTFRLLQPYAFVPLYGGPTVTPTAWQVAANVLAPRLNPLWLDQMAKSRLQQAGADDAPPNHQWATRTPFVFPWRNLVRYGLGWPLGLAAWLGWLWALVEGLRGRPESWRHVLPAAWIALCFGWFGAGWVLATRYVLPLVPALCLTAAWALVRIAAPQHDASLPGAAAPPRWRRAAGGLAIALVLLPTYAWALAFTSIYTRPHTRIAASRWLYDTLPWKLTLHVEHADGSAAALPLGLAASMQPAATPGRPELPLTVVAPARRRRRASAPPATVCCAACRSPTPARSTTARRPAWR